MLFPKKGIFVLWNFQIGLNILQSSFTPFPTTPFSTFKAMKILPFLLVVLNFIGCNFIRPSDSNDASISLKQGQTATVEIKVNESVTINGIHVLTFNSLTDSRCAEDVQCVWQGVASPKFTLALSGVRTDFQLDTLNYEPYHNFSDVTGYTIKLVDVTPYPNHKKNIFTGDTVKLEITLKG
jgi:hypothetical protein